MLINVLWSFWLKNCSTIYHMGKCVLANTGIWAWWTIICHWKKITNIFIITVDMRYIVDSMLSDITNLYIYVELTQYVCLRWVWQLLYKLVHSFVFVHQNWYFIPKDDSSNIKNEHSQLPFKNNLIAYEVQNI